MRLYSSIVLLFPPFTGLSTHLLCTQPPIHPLMLSPTHHFPIELQDNLKMFSFFRNFGCYVPADSEHKVWVLPLICPSPVHPSIHPSIHPLIHPTPPIHSPTPPIHSPAHSIIFVRHTSPAKKSPIEDFLAVFSIFFVTLSSTSWSWFYFHFFSFLLLFFLFFKADVHAPPFDLAGEVCLLNIHWKGGKWIERRWKNERFRKITWWRCRDCQGRMGW